MTTRDIRALLLDVDGTLLTSGAKGMPPSARAALDACRARGIRLFLATGRHPMELECLRGYPFDGGVLLNGQYCVDDKGEMFYDNPIDPGDIASLVRQLSRENYCCAFVEAGVTYLNAVDDAVREVNRAVALPVPPVMDIRRALTRRIYQLNPYLPAALEHIPMSALPHCVVKRWYPLYCDVLPASGGKAVGVRRLLERYGIPLGQCAAFGDSENDLELLQSAGVSVAMGNATEACKRVADFVTDTNDRDGLARGIALALSGDMRYDL